jgi:hypothetical protein
VHVTLRRSFQATFLAVVLLMYASAQLAHADTEPNDSILQAEGPLSAQTYAGEIGSETDVDWYYLQLGSQKQITFTASVLNAEECGQVPEVELLDFFGLPVHEFFLPSDDFVDVQVQSSSFSWTTPPGSNPYYVRVAAGYSYSAGCKYSFSITPQSAYAAAPDRPVVQVPPGYVSEDRAYRVDKAGTYYQGTIERSQKQNWIELEVAADKKLTVTQTTSNCSGERSLFTLGYPPGFVSVGRLATIDLDSPDTNSHEGNARRTIPVQPFDSLYYLETQGGVGCTWQLEVWPSSALISGKNGPTTPRTCATAQKLLRRAKNHEKQTAKTLQSVHGYRPHAKALLSLEAQRRKVRAARHQVARLCAKN